MDLPAFHDDRDASLAELWRLLDEGVARGRSPFHTPALATLDAEERPRLRTVVLRGLDPVAGTLRFHCDRRSAKFGELAARPACALHAYDPASKVQIRVEGRAGLHTDDAPAEAAWQAAQAMSRVCYGTDPAPGTSLPAGDAYRLPDPEAALTLGRPHFALVEVRAEYLEFLYLDRRGHRRAGWRRAGMGWAGTWLVP